MHNELDEHDVKFMVGSIIEVRGVQKVSDFLIREPDNLETVYRGFRVRIEDLVVEDGTVMKVAVRFVGDVETYWFTNPRTRLFKEIRALLDILYEGQIIKDGSHASYYKPFLKPDITLGDRPLVMSRCVVISGAWAYPCSECSLHTQGETRSLSGHLSGVHSVIIRFERPSAEDLENLVSPEDLLRYFRANP